jgi:3'-phosphoadenosine 5'-phosphosulfate sulfotransferase (PAPS reductase)/FAD synthetase
VGAEFQFRNLEHYRQYLALERVVVGVSGGRSSGYQMAHLVTAARKFLGAVPPNWIFMFENTGLERWETYVFIRKLDDYFKLNLIITEYDPEAPGRYRIVTHDTLSREGEPMQKLLSEIVNRRDGTRGVRPLPNPVQRTCTANLKIKTAHRYVRRTLKWPMQYYAALGYRADEKARCDKRWLRDELKGFDEGGIGIFPMFDDGVVQDDVERFFYTGPFDLELDSDFGNCDFCFMASTWKIKQRMVLVALETQTPIRPGSKPPARVQRWIDWEERVSDRPGTFRKDRPSMHVLWEQVCEGNLESAVPERKDDVCKACTD